MAIIKVLQVFTIMNRGGAESMIMNYYRNIDRDKIQFDFLVHRKEKAAFDDEIESLGGKIYRIDPINPFFPGEYYNRLRTFFKEHTEYAIVHSHLNTFSSFPLKIAREFKIPCRIAHAHTAFENIKLRNFIPNKENLTETVKKLIKFRLKKKVSTYATHRFSCGDKAGQWLFGENNDFYTMNNAIDTKKFIHNPETDKKYRKELNLEDKVIIGHVGRLNNAKNHSYLLRIFANIIEERPDCVLVLVGNGELQQAIEQEIDDLGIQDQVKMLGVRSDIPELLQMMDVFVFPSFYEGLPVTLIEAQAAGLKILASDTITQEVKLTDDIEFVSIQKPTSFWVNKIFNALSYEKQDNSDKISEAGYDIVSNTEKIQSFYLNNK
ncbi:glycosyltransferase family 1 protein [Aquimarina algiphila]|uniref:glycosyltransferase family 1 protein n=1 Tax=Aquimarina algiphila TaxID=2047982 RepID=UPI0024915251|nr:glycosyltransferase family 1 protein [Aquimarina algiphila]